MKFQRTAIREKFDPRNISAIQYVPVIIWLHSKPGFPFRATNAAFGPGSGLIFLDNVDCTGTEPSLLECRSQDPGVHNCGRTEDAGVYCPGEEGE